MKRVITAIEAILFAARWLIVPIYLAMIVLLGMLVVFFLLDLSHIFPKLMTMSEDEMIVLALSLIDLSLSANLVLLVILSGYENFVSRIPAVENSSRPEWLSKIDFAGLKLKLLGSITVIAAVHLLGSFMETDDHDIPRLGWQILIVVTFAVLGLIFAITDKIGSDDH
jgi:uncharacterized protein (TIGR00645 family)